MGHINELKYIIKQAKACKQKYFVFISAYPDYMEKRLKNLGFTVSRENGSSLIQIQCNT